jgi:hypothetical protein
VDASLKGDPVPDEHHVLRHCSGTVIERTGEDLAIGVTSAAFEDDDPDGVSVTWIEWFGASDDPERAAIDAIRATRTVRPRHRFGKFNVGLIKMAGSDAGVDLEVAHDPEPGNGGHSVIVGLKPNAHTELMARLVIDLVALLA